MLENRYFYVTVHLFVFYLLSLYRSDPGFAMEIYRIVNKRDTVKILVEYFSINF